MGITSEGLRIKEQTISYIEECVTEFRILRRNRDKTKDVFSPCLTDISTSSSFHDLIHLCSEHDPTVLKSVLKIALEKCAKAEEQINEEKAKKREAEKQLGLENYKKAKLQRLDKSNTASGHQGQVVPNSGPVSKVPLPPDALKSGVTGNQDSHSASQAYPIPGPSAVAVQASADTSSQSFEGFMELDPFVSPTLYLATVSEDVVLRCDQRRSAESIQDWTGTEYGLESREDMEYESDVNQEDTEYESGFHQDTEYELGTHQEDTGLQQTSPDIESHDCISTTENATMSPGARSNGSNLFVPAPVVDEDQSMKVTLESSNIASPIRSSVTASPPSSETILTNNPAKTQTPSIDDVERGLVRGEEKIKEFVMEECMPFISYCHAKKRASPSDELRELFLTCRKLPLRIVKGRLLVELRNRIMSPGQKTAIPSTADLFNPGDILDALQSIKMTTINAKVNRAYGQMRLFKSVQGKIMCPSYVPDKALTHGVAAHRSVLAQMVRRFAGNLSEKELVDKINSCIYEYEAGQKWVHVGEWFGGEGIILVFVTAGEWNQKFFLSCAPRQIILI